MQRKDIRQIREKIKSKIGVRHKVFFIALLLIIAILFLDYLLGGVTHYLFSRDIHELSAIIGGFGIIGPIIFVLFVILEVMIAPIPGFILYVTGAAIFGWFLGGVLVLVGNMIGAALCFYLAKYLGRDYIESKISRKNMEIFDKYSDKYGGYAVFFLRINPFTSSDIVSYAAGFSNMPFRDFFLGTLFGLMPLAFIQTYFGNTLISLSPVLYWIFLGLSLAYFFGMICLLMYAAAHSNRKA